MSVQQANVGAWLTVTLVITVISQLQLADIKMAS